MMKNVCFDLSLCVLFWRSAKSLLVLHHMRRNSCLLSLMNNKCCKNSLIICYQTIPSPGQCLRNPLLLRKPKYVIIFLKQFEETSFFKQCHTSQWMITLFYVSVNSKRCHLPRATSVQIFKCQILAPGQIFLVKSQGGRSSLEPLTLKVFSTPHPPREVFGW